MTAELNTLAPGGFGHEALLYEDESAFVAGAVEFMTRGFEAGEAILVMVGPARIAALGSALGVDRDRVNFADMRSVGGNPARIIPAWRRFAQAHGDHPVRGIGEPVWAEPGPAEMVEAQCHEHLLNLAFADRPDLRLLCPYDTRHLGNDAIAEARSSHPSLREHGGQRASHDYSADPAAVLARALPPAPADADALEFDADLLRTVREVVLRRAADYGLDAPRAASFVLAVDEVATNSIRYGGGCGSVRCWSDRAALVCEIRDHGRIKDPLVGRVRPAPGAVGGRGLWIANQVCDLVQIRSDRAGTTVRLHARRR